MPADTSSEPPCSLQSSACQSLILPAEFSQAASWFLQIFVSVELVGVFQLLLCTAGSLPSTWQCETSAHFRCTSRWSRILSIVSDLYWIAGEWQSQFQIVSGLHCSSLSPSNCKYDRVRDVIWLDSMVSYLSADRMKVANNSSCFKRKCPGFESRKFANMWQFS